MLNKIFCQRCNAMKDGPAFKVQGPSIAHVVVDQVVCGDCHAAHHEHMEQEFWKGASRLGNGKCPKCGGRLTSHNSKPAYRASANGDSAHEVHLVCDSCHAEYKSCCRSAVEKSQGEDNVTGKDTGVGR